MDTTEKAIVYVKDLDMFVTVQFLEDAPAVLHLGNPAMNVAEVRPSNPIRSDIEEGEEHRSDLQGEVDEPDSAEQQREQDELEAKHAFWCISGNFVCTCHKKARFLSRSSIWCCQATNTALDVLQECQIGEYWNVNGVRQLSGPWTGSLSSLHHGYTWSGWEIDIDSSNVQA